MAILIDPPAWPAHGTLWSHLVSDADYDELHAFAARLGIPRRGFDLDHYDVPAARYEEALAHGALPVGAKDVVHRLRDAGLRVRQAEREAVTPVRRRQYLVAEWAGLGEALGAGGTGGAIVDRGAGSTRAAEAWQRLGSELIGRWNEPHRSYHDERHLEDVLLALDQLSVRGERVSPATLLAAWFHDAVYTGAAGTDELDSARLAHAALSGLGLETGLTGQVSELIVATTPAGVGGGAADGTAAGDEARGAAGSTSETRIIRAASHLLDADLSIFAAGPHRYAEYTAAVRTEYAHVADAEFAAGRARILDAYVSRPAIYATAAGQQLWEDRARANLAREIGELLR